MEALTAIGVVFLAILAVGLGFIVIGAITVVVFDALLERAKAGHDW